MPIADRKEECRHFRQLIRRKLATRILLIEGRGEQGKTTLLAEFAVEARQQFGISGCAALELKPGLLLRQVFQTIQQGLRLPADSKYVLARNAEPRVLVSADFSGANVGDSNKFQVGSNIGLNESQQVARLGEALLDDLAQWPKTAVILLDTYEQATPECISWLVDGLLPVVARNDRLFCVVGGRTIPDRNEYRLSWGGVADAKALAKDITLEEWHDYACALFPGFPRADLAVVYVGLKDRPGSIRAYIESIGGQLDAT